MVVDDYLKKIEDNGYEAYIVGGYVRDKLLGITSSDVDICTNAKVKDILNIFKDINCSSNEYGSVKIVTNTLRIDITTYRKDIKYNGNRRQLEIEYVDNLVEDLERRDFTMNALCMNRDGEIIDIYNGQEDIKNKLIRSIGDPDKRIKEDPLRALRAIRFATTLDFKIEPVLYKALEDNKELISTLSLDKIKEELGKILVSKNAIKGLDYLRRLGYLKLMGIDYNNIENVCDINGMYSQLIFNKEYPFSKEEKQNIEKIKEILSKGTIDKREVYNYGYYICIVAGSILNISTEEISKIDKSLKIKNIKDIDITSEDICNILGIEPNKTISDVYNELKDLIIDDKVDNDHELLCEYVYTNRKKWLNEKSN